MTGPTYPQRESMEIAGKTTDYKLLRSWAKEKEPGKQSTIPLLEFSGQKPDGFLARCEFRKNNTGDDWTTIEMIPEGDKMIAILPTQPPAGKLAYSIILYNSDSEFVLTETPVVIRFKDYIPGWIPLPHVLLIFVSLLFSTMAAVEALRRGNKVRIYALLAAVSMLIGGLIMGPFMQKYAFGEWWTGWPWGSDLTDTKTMAAFFVWVIAYIVLRVNPKNRFWPVFAAIVTLGVFVIPHSLLGSEFDYSAGEVVTGR
ncbi:MAG: hypothetical protein DRJ15_04575 [Bacteroidetes bacterium]|nr:MAG: hypothetical protein DRJ15_04575 [Bacteroidota bacterium]